MFNVLPSVYLANLLYLQNGDYVYSLLLRTPYEALIYFMHNSYGKSGYSVSVKISDDLFTRE